jgi:hypothetical protein
MKLSLGAKSLGLFGISLVVLLLLTLFESSLTDMSQAVERLISGLILVLPGVAGVIFGAMSIIRKEPKRWMAYLGIMLNALFALFQIIVLSFAG